MIESGEWPTELVPIYDVTRTTKPPLKAIMLDACQKLNLLAGMGTSYADIHPVLSTYMGVPHQEVLQRMQAVHSSSGQPRAAAPNGGGEAELPCHPNLRCARDFSRVGNGVLDYFGVMGAVCCHGFPLVGCFVAMPAPEQYMYYDAVLTWVLKRTRVVDCYIDFACQYKRHLKAGGFCGLQCMVTIQGVASLIQPCAPYDDLVCI